MLPRIRFGIALPLTALALACENPNPTQPDGPGNSASADFSSVAASNSWTSRAPNFTEEFFGFNLGMAPDASGQSIVYAFGGCDGEGAFGHCTGHSVRAYNVATNTWTIRLSQVGVFRSNGIGKIGSRLYFSGGYNTGGSVPDATNALWAYDYSNDRMISKANLPIFSAEGVSGVINGKLYVLPGACSGSVYPNPGYCAVEETRRFYRYDPGTNAWVTRRQAPHFHRNGAAGVIDGKLYVAGGSGTAALDVYDPATNSWSTRASLPLAGPAHGAVIGGQFYVVVAHSPENRLYAYSRNTNQWKVKAAPPFFGSVTRVTLDGRGRLFMATGNRSALYTP